MPFFPLDFCEYSMGVLHIKCIPAVNSHSTQPQKATGGKQELNCLTALLPIPLLKTSYLAGVQLIGTAFPNEQEKNLWFVFPLHRAVPEQTVRWSSPGTTSTPAKGGVPPRKSFLGGDSPAWWQGGGRTPYEYHGNKGDGKADSITLFPKDKTHNSSGERQEEGTSTRHPLALREVIKHIPSFSSFLVCAFVCLFGGFVLFSKNLES